MSRKIYRTIGLDEEVEKELQREMRDKERNRSFIINKMLVERYAIKEKLRQEESRADKA